MASGDQISVGGERLLSVQEVAQILGICVRQVWRMVAEKKLPLPLQMGRKATRFLLSEITEYIEKLKKERIRTSAGSSGGGQ